MNQDALLLELPLSWIRGINTTVRLQSIPLLFKQTHWLSLAEIPAKGSFTSIIDDALCDHKGLFLRGCSPQIADQLKKKGFDTLPTGQEALLPLYRTTPLKKSTRALIRRGNKHGRLKKLLLDTENIKKLQHLKRNSVHGRKPQLRHLFWGNASRLTPAFIWEDEGGNWLAALTISHSHSEKAHTELMIRHRRAPVGVMEALIAATCTALRTEGYCFLSLGEAPFIVSKNTRAGIRAMLVNGAGTFFRFAYNAQSLYRFKDKFSPQWQQVYICAYPRISLINLLAIAWHSRYIHLLVHQLKSSSLLMLVNFAFMAYG